MSGFKFEFDERKFKGEVQQAAQKGVDQLAKDWTRDVERMCVQYKGKPISIIKLALKRLFERDGGKITERELTEYAQMISEGTTIVFKPERIRF